MMYRFAFGSDHIGFVEHPWRCNGLLMAVTVLDMRSFCTDDGFIRGLQNIPYWCRLFDCWL